jgi:hypothetical protein
MLSFATIHRNGFEIPCRAAWLIATLPLLGACDSAVTITYQEVATCHFVEGGYGGSAPGAEYFIFYKIVSVDNSRPQAIDFNFGPSNLLFQADVPLPLALPPTGVVPLKGLIVAKGTIYAAQGDKGAIGLQGPERQALLTAPSHPLVWDKRVASQTVTAVAAPYTRVDLDQCTIAQLQGL